MFSRIMRSMRWMRFFFLSPFLKIISLHSLREQCLLTIWENLNDGVMALEAFIHTLYNQKKGDYQIFAKIMQKL